jgi:molecular chaperone DnaK
LKQEVEGKIAALRSALQGTDINYVRNTVEELSQTMQKIGAAVYQQAGAPPPPGEAPGGEAPGGPTGGEEGTVEGEFREV